MIASVRATAADRILGSRLRPPPPAATIAGGSFHRLHRSSPAAEQLAPDPTKGLAILAA